MKVFRRKEFLKLPPGTFYCQGERWAFGNICVKFDTLGHNDWVYLNFDSIEAFSSIEESELLDEMLDAETSHPLSESAGRDGLFDQDAIFLVYEREDLLKIRKYLDDALGLPSLSGLDA